MEAPRLAYLLGLAPVIDGVIQITPEIQSELTRFDDARLFPSPLRLPEINPNLQLRTNPATGRCVAAGRLIPAGEIILRNNGSRVSLPLRYSWQVAERAHAIGPGLIDHNCSSPTAGIDPATGDLIGLRDIRPGEMVTFNYLTTEFDMAVPFECRCGGENCYGFIRGFRYLTGEQRRNLTKRLPTAKHLLEYLE